MIATIDEIHLSIVQTIQDHTSQRQALANLCDAYVALDVPQGGIEHGQQLKRPAIQFSPT